MHCLANKCGRVPGLTLNPRVRGSNYDRGVSLETGRKSDFNAFPDADEEETFGTKAWEE